MAKFKFLYLIFPYALGFLFAFLIIRENACHTPCLPNAICTDSYAWRLFWESPHQKILLIAFVVSFLLGLFFQNNKILRVSLILVSYGVVLSIILSLYNTTAIIGGICGGTPNRERIIRVMESESKHPITP